MAVFMICCVTAVRAEVIFEEDFDGLSSPTLLRAVPGWRITAGDIKVSDTGVLGRDAIDGNLSPAGSLSRAYRAFAAPEVRGKLMLTFTAVALTGSNNSSVGFATVDRQGKATDLVHWTYEHGQWKFDARGITVERAGQQELFENVYAGRPGETVTCQIVVDAGGHWVWGSVTDATGQVHKSKIFELPAANEKLSGAVLVRQDLCPSNGPLDIDDIRVTFESAPPLPATRERLPLTIVEYSWTSPDTKYLHDNVAEMEKRPLDGVTVRVADPRLAHGNLLNGVGKGDAGWAAFQNKPLSREVIEPAIEDLKTMPFGKFRSNYLCIVSYLPNRQTMNWFDDDWWANITRNSAMLAEVAQKGGCEGIMFDPEMYGCAFWRFSDLAKEPMYAGKSYDDVTAVVRRRGREFMRAINASFPGVRIYLLHAWERVLWEVADDLDRLKEAKYGLLIPFLDGMLEAADEDTIIMDGIENGYYLEERVDFQNKVDRVMRYGPRISAVPKHFRKKVRTGFGIWVDRNRKWFPADIEKNFWSPEKIRKVVTNALIASDGFVWIYTERATFWLDSPTAKLGGGIKLSTGVGNHIWRNEEIKWMPRAYWQAIEKARQDALAERRQQDK